MALQRTAARSRQRGLSFIGVIFIGVLAVALFAVGGKSVPIFIEYFAIKKAAIKAARDGSTVPEIRAAFEKQREIEYSITSITGKDLDISKENERVVVRFAYDKEVPIYPPVFLLIRYAGRSD